jgi:predicted molibdopterin-dependent oxidoreductase YjgC
MGFMPDFYPGYQPVANVANRQRFEAAWGVNLNSTPGLTLTEILGAIHKGQIKAAYIIGDDPVLHGKLESLEFLVVQGMFPSPAGQVADVILPAASFVEKEGTFTNAERRVQRIRQAIQPIGRSKPDWWITCQIALRLGAKGFNFEGPSQIMVEVGNIAPIYAGISYDRLEKIGLQWPCLSSQSEGTTILHQASFNGGKGKFTPLENKSPTEATDPDYPLILTTESNLYYFHTGAMGVSLGEFSVLAGRPEVLVSLADAAKYGIDDNEVVHIVSRWGGIEAKVKVNSFMPVGVVSMPLHFVQNILSPVIDPVSKIPEYQVCAVKLEK